ncbi:hypothetical protein F4818DRAFT_442000 [Hypoxylon cercidicola]|nr:hypothetical protein F4818DRAFT_442000 [Hypoxylon cercidicola]
MRSNNVTLLAPLLLLSHNVCAFDVYLNKDEGCPDGVIDRVCENQAVGICCEGLDNTEYYSAQASDGQKNIALYSSQGGNKCAVTITTDDTCATTSTGGGTGAGAVVSRALPERGDEDPTQDDDPTNEEPAGESEGSSGDHSRAHARSLSGGRKETWIEKNKRAPIVNGWRHNQYTAYAYVDRTHVYKLSRDSPLAPGYEAIEALPVRDREAEIAYLKRYGEVKTRAEARLPELP